MVEILRLGIIVVQDNVFISLISTFLRQLGTSSAIDFLDNDGTGFGVCERNVECDISVYEFYLVCQSVEYMLVGFITDLYTVYAVGQGELRCTVLVGYRLVGIAAVDVFDLDGDAFPKVFRIIVRIDGSHLQGVQLVFVRIAFVEVRTSSE